MTPNMEKKLSKLEKEFINNGEDNYILELRRAEFSELENKLKDLSKHREAIEETMDRDEALREAKEKVKELRAPYSDQKRWNSKRAKLVYLIMCEEHAAQMKDYGSV